MRRRRRKIRRRRAFNPPLNSPLHILGMKDPIH